MKAQAIEGMYDRQETVEGQQDIYRIAAARDRSGKAICQICRVRNRANPFVRDMLKFIRTSQMSVHGYPADK